jgi:hypothetical protein
MFVFDDGTVVGKGCFFGCVVSTKIFLFTIHFDGGLVPLFHFGHASIPTGVVNLQFSFFAPQFSWVPLAKGFFFFRVIIVVAKATHCGRQGGGGGGGGGGVDFIFWIKLRSESFFWVVLVWCRDGAAVLRRVEPRFYPRW